MERINITVAQVMAHLKTKRESSDKENPEAIVKNVFSKKERGHIQFHYLRKGVLGIKVDSSSWLYHLNLQKKNLLAKAHKNTPTVKEIRFSLGEITETT